LKASRARDTGQIEIRVSSSLWVYNCTGMPIALRQLPMPSSRRRSAAVASSAGQTGHHPVPVSAAHGASAAVAAAVAGDPATAPASSILGMPNAASLSASGRLASLPISSSASVRSGHSGHGPSSRQADASGTRVSAPLRLQPHQQADTEAQATSEVWVPPCLGPDGELLQLVVPRASHTSAAQATQQALATAHQSAMEPAGQHYTGAPEQGSRPPPRIPSILGLRAASGALTQQLGSSTTATFHPDRSSRAASAHAHAINTPSSVTATSVATPATGSTASRFLGHAGVEAGSMGGGRATGIGGHGNYGSLSIGRAASVAGSQSSAMSRGSRSSFYLAAELSQLLGTPALMPALCGTILHEELTPLQLRIVPQGGSSASTRNATQDTPAEAGGKGTQQQWWSTPLRLSAGGGVEVVALPCPLPKEDAASGGVSDMHAGAYFVAVRLVRVRGCGGRTWALHILPRFVLHNALPAQLQLQQQGVGRVRTMTELDDKWRPLDPGQRRPLHWPNAGKPLLLALRVSEPGWSWSGSVDLGAAEPGDVFVKVSLAER
jgi:hypothetical protein